MDSVPQVLYNRYNATADDRLLESGYRVRWIEVPVPMRESV